jgi:hypothetical protein
VETWRPPANKFVLIAKRRVRIIQNIYHYEVVVKTFTPKYKGLVNEAL